MPDDFDREEDIPAKQQQKKPVEKPKPVSKEIIPQFYHAGGKPISKETIKEHAFQFINSSSCFFNVYSSMLVYSLFTRGS